MGNGTKLIGSGSATPKTVVSNDDLSKIVNTNDEWISVRTGIRNRRILSGSSPILLLMMVVVMMTKKGKREGIMKGSP